MTHPRSQRRHFRTAQREVNKSNNDFSFIELDFRKTTIIIALVSLLQGLILGLALKRR